MQPYNNKTDIWALGCILYEICSLTYPFEGTSMKALVGKILVGAYAPLPQRFSEGVLRMQLQPVLYWSFIVLARA